MRHTLPYKPLKNRLALLLAAAHVHISIFRRTIERPNAQKHESFMLSIFGDVSLVGQLLIPLSTSLDPSRAANLTCGVA